MSGEIAAACCCTPEGECQRKRDFQFASLFLPTQEYLNNSSVVSGGCPDFPPCNNVVEPCQAVTLGGCRADYIPQTLAGDSPIQPGIKIHYVASILGAEVKVTVPYVSTSIETVYPVNCNWISGGVDSGLYFEAEREVDYNAGGYINFDMEAVNSACCTQVTLNPEGSYHHEIRARYRWRCTYTLPPAYLSVQRPAGLYAGYTWEITGGAFIVRDGGGAIVANVNLATLTLAQARTAIDALVYVICTANQGAVAADTMSALLMYDRPAAALQTFPVRVPLEPAGSEVGLAQDGVFGPSWQIESWDLDALTPYAYCTKLFPFKATCQASVYDYTGGQDAPAQKNFCYGVSSEYHAWEGTYDPCNPLGADCGGVSLCLNYPQGYFTCADTGGPITWVETTPAAPGIPQFPFFSAFGTRATPTTTSPQVFSSDKSTLCPTSCSSSTFNDIDFGDCGSACATACYAQFIRSSWAMARNFRIIRL